MTPAALSWIVIAINVVIAALNVWTLRRYWRAERAFRAALQMFDAGTLERTARLARAARAARTAGTPPKP
jgi:uncharacterized protein HemY